MQCSRWKSLSNNLLCFAEFLSIKKRASRLIETCFIPMQSYIFFKIDGSLMTSISDPSGEPSPLGVSTGPG